MRLFRPLNLFVIAAFTLVGIPLAQSATSTAVKPSSTTTTSPTTFSLTAGLSGYKMVSGFETAIKQFEKSAVTQPVKTGGTVFIGSSSFTRWKSMEKDMAEFDAVNRGFGGSKSDDLLFYEKRILKPLQPRQIVYYCGGNDVDKKRSADVVISNIQSFIQVARKDFPGVKIYYVATNYTPKRIAMTNTVRQINRTMEQWAKSTTDVIYIDAMPGLVDDEDKAIPQLFVKDGVHLNASGYRIWQSNITMGMR